MFDGPQAFALKHALRRPRDQTTHSSRSRSWPAKFRHSTANEMLQQIRKARELDISYLPAIERAADRLFPEGRIPGSGSTYPTEDLLRALHDGLLLVAELDGVVVGFAVAGELEHALHLYALAVHPDYARRGFGRGLVDGIIEESARRALTGVTLTTFKDLSWNGPFYAQAGFRTLEVHETGAALASILSAEKSAGMCLRIAMMRRNTVQPVHAADQIP